MTLGQGCWLVPLVALTQATSVHKPYQEARDILRFWSLVETGNCPQINCDMQHSSGEHLACHVSGFWSDPTQS